MNLRKIFIILIILICVLSLAYGIYYQVFEKNKEKLQENIRNNNEILDVIDFDDLFDNDINYQDYTVSSKNKIDQTKELVYTAFTLNEVNEEKYDIKVSIPTININNENIANINKEINTIFQGKVNSIKAKVNAEDVPNSIYTVEYTAYLNENILSLVIRATLKEGNNAQRLIIKAYTYNLSTNEIIPLTDMLEIKGVNENSVKSEIRRVVQEGIAKTNNLIALGYKVYERDINSDIYEIKNSNNYLLGPNGALYIIYAYGNTRYTSEKDVVVIK